MVKKKNVATERCNLVLQRAKTEVYCWEGGLPRTPEGLVMARKEVDGVFERWLLGVLWFS